ncbi:SDR family NAD(P)-dependent oxidoreductase [uncultured Cellulomonas sp.]|uniref:SDR family NAD(P)-dependent oxidoreductase n=1 Tax=uncultured Cellulomonas sp. TaxID=189682 RepID=UPI0028EEB44D|nr:SDR family NAD(P)-dependent oxidoreductase [uncultured Cellulomonas sp.]
MADGAVLVVGASSGIGRATAQALAARGRPLVLSSRSADVLETVATECRSAAERHGVAGLRVTVVPADVSDRASIDALFARARSVHGRIDAVVNTVAVVAYGRFDEVPAEAFDRVMEVNLVGTANVARRALATFSEQGGGHLVVVGSLLGRIATPWMSTYVTSKWAVHGLARTLQIEARQVPGVHVSLISPGGVDTPVYSQAAAYGGRNGRPPPPVSRPEDVAAAIVRVLDRPRRTVSVGLANHVAEAGFRYLPGIYDRLVRPLMFAGGLSRRRVATHPGNLWAPTPSGEAVHGGWGRHWLRGVAAGGLVGTALVVRRIVHRS